MKQPNRRIVSPTLFLTCLIAAVAMGWLAFLRFTGEPVSNGLHTAVANPAVSNPAPATAEGRQAEVHDGCGDNCPLHHHQAVPHADSPVPVAAAMARRTWERDFFTSRCDATPGAPIRFELTGGVMAVGTVRHVEHADRELIYVSGELTEPEQGRFFIQKQLVPGKQGEFAGVVELFQSRRAWRVEPSGPNGESELVERRMDEVICLMPPPSAETLAAEAQEIPPLDPSDVPDYVPPHNDGIISLQSLPGATGVLYIDYRGGYTPTWGGISYSKPGVSNAQIKDVWKRVAEDFMPFNINVTTDIKVFDAAPQGRRQRCICTNTTTAAPGAGGVSYLDSWNWGGDTPNWSFYTTGKSAAEVISHEVGHALNLGHDGRTSPSEGYFGGHGGGSVGWGPIMGVGYYQSVTQWSKGEYTNANNLQNDLVTITNNNAVDYRADDTGDSLATARYLEVYADQTVFAEGVIETSGDTDAFRFSTHGGNVSLRVDPAPGDWANLAIMATLSDSAGTVISSNNPQSQLWASVAGNLAAGTYTLKVTGAGRNDPASNGFSNYASLGYYSVSGTISNAVPMTYLSIAENSANGTNVGTVAANNPNGNPLVYSIVSGNTGNVFALDNNGVLTVSNGTPLDYETLALNTQFTVQYELFVSITNPANPALNEANRRVAVKVLDVNETPAATGFSATVYANSPPGTVVGTVAGTDPDDYTTVSFSIIGGNPNNAFSINPASGIVTVSGSLPSAMAGNHVLNVQVSDGSLTALVGANITVLAGYSGVWANASGGSWGTASNWSGGVVAGGPGETADFSTLNLTTNRTVNLDGDRMIGTLLFGDTTPNANWTINPGSGGTLGLSAGGTPVITVNNQTTTIGAVLAGSRGLLKNGPGVLTLTAANTYTGTTLIDAGKLIFKAPSNADWTLPSGITIASGATETIDFTAHTTQYRKTSLGANVINAGGVLELTGTNNDVNDWYLISSWTASGEGTIRVLNGAVSCWTGSTNALAGFTGLIDIQGGQFSGNVSGSTTLGGTFDVNVGPAGKLDLRSGNFTMDALSGSGALIKSWTGDTVVFTIGSNNGSGAWTGSMSGSNYNLVKSGAGTQTLSGSGITFPGTTTVNQGSLLLSNTTAFASAVMVNAGGTFGGTGSTSAAVTVNSGGTLVPGGNGIGTLSINNALTLAGTVNAEISKSAGTADRVQGVTTLTYGGVLNVVNLSGTPVLDDTFALFGATNHTGAFSAINLPGLGAGLTWDLSNLSVNGSIKVNNYTGVNPPATAPTGLAATAVSASQINLTWTAVAGATSYGVSRDGTPVATASGASFSDTGLSMGTTYSYTVTAINAGGSSAASDSTSATTPLVGAALAWDANTGSAGQQDGSGTWNNINPNWWQGSSNFTWANGNAVAFGVNTASDCTVTLANDVTPTGITFNATSGGTYTVSGSGGISLSGGVPVTTNANGNLNVVLKGSGSLTKGGPATLVLAAANTHTGGTTVSAGTLQFPFSSRPGWNHNSVNHVNLGTVTVAPGATLDLNDVDNVLENVLFTGGTVVTGGGTLNKTGAGQIEFWNPGSPSSIGSFTGQINVLQGTLGNNNSDWSDSAGLMDLHIAAGAFFDMRVGNVKVDDFTGSGTVTRSYSGSYALHVGNANGGGDFSGIIRNGTGGGTLGFTKAGTGTQTLSGVNTYTGPTTINGGKLLVNGSLAAGSTVSVHSGASLAGRGTVNGPVTLAAGATLSAGDAAIGTLTVGNPLALHDSGTVALRVNKSGATRTADKIHLTGATGVTYKGKLTVTIEPGSDALGIGDKFTLFSRTAGTFTGSFATLEAPTPGAGLLWSTANLNVDGSIEVVADLVSPMPAFSPDGGTYIGPLEVEISTGIPGASVRYTTDGSDPKTSVSALSSASPATVNIAAPASVTLKAYVFGAGFDDSAVATASYETYAAGSAVWTNPAGGSWPETANWLGGGVANGSGVTARFDTLSLTSNPVVNLDSTQIVGGIIFGDAGNQYSWTLAPGSGGQLTLDAAGTPVINVANQTATLTTPLAGTKGLLKSGTGTLALTAENTYSGTTIISQGRLQLNVVNTLPSTANIVIGDSNSGATAPNLYLGNQLNPNFASLIVGSGVAGAALHTSGWAPTVSGITTLNSALTIKQYNGGGVHTGIQNNGKITGPGAGSGNDTLILQYGGSQNFYWQANNTVANDFSGNIRITGAAGNMNAQGGANGPNNVVIPDAALITIDAGCTFRWNNFGNYPVNETFDGLAGTGNMSRNTGGGLISSLNLTINANNGANDGTRNFTGSLSGLNSLTFGGTGTQRLGGASTYTGTTAINGGTLLVNGSLGNTPTTVNAGGTLGGTGSIGGATTVNGTLAPGNNAVGNLTLNNTLTLAGGSHIAWEITDWTGTAGNGYDKLTATSLNLTATAGSPITIHIDEADLTNFANEARTFILLQSTSAITGFDPARFVIDAGALTTPQGTWAIQQSGNNLVLAFAATPDANSNGIYDTWETVHFGNASAGANQPGDDVDNDGLSNLMEYALDTDPLAHNSGPAVDVVTIDTDRHLRITVNKNPQAANLAYTVETCGALHNWSAANTVIETNTGTQLIVRDSVSTASSPRRFIRLRVGTNP